MEDISVRGARNGYYVALLVALGFLVAQIVTTGRYHTDILAVIVAALAGYFGSVLYYRRTGGDPLPLVEE